MSLFRSKAKKLLKMWLPRILADCIVGRVDRSHPFQGVYRAFDQIPKRTRYNCPSLLLDIKQELHRRVDTRDDIVTSLPVAGCRSQIVNLLPLLIASMDRRDGQRLRVLDYGGAGGQTYLDNSDMISMEGVDYWIHDLPETMSVGKQFFERSGLTCQVRFIEDLSSINAVDIVYCGSALQYIPDYRSALAQLMIMRPKCFLLTDHFMGRHPTFATAQVNMRGRRMAYWIFQLDEIVELFKARGYRLVYKSSNYQPYHDLNNFDERYRVRDSSNLLFWD